MDGSFEIDVNLVRLIDWRLLLIKKGPEFLEASSNMLDEILVFADYKVLFGNPNFLQVDQPIIGFIAVT